MTKICAVLLAAFLLSGCATTYYVGQGQEQSFKSQQECMIAHPEDGNTYCVNRAEYTQATQNTWSLILNGVLTAALVALTIGAFVK